jgi:hypothetical protein
MIYCNWLVSSQSFFFEEVKAELHEFLTMMTAAAVMEEQPQIKEPGHSQCVSFGRGGKEIHLLHLH